MRAVLAVVLAVAISILLHWRLGGGVSDVDAFYHLRHASVYRTAGPGDSAFPWASCSVVRTEGADLWYGFHVLTIPLTLHDDLARGLVTGGVAVTTVALLLLLAALARLGVARPWCWLLLLVATSGDVAHRLTMLRPHPLSLGLILLLFAFVVRPPARPAGRMAAFREVLAPGAICAIIAWIHLALAWIPILVVVAVAALRLAVERRFVIRPLAAGLAGLALGCLARPAPFGALRLARIQVVDLLLARRADLPLRFGRELYPYGLRALLDQYLPLILLVATLAAVRILSGRMSPRLRVASGVAESGGRVGELAASLLSGFFLLLSATVARRSAELAVAFAVAAAALFLSRIAATWPPARRGLGCVLLAVGLALAVPMAVRTTSRFERHAAEAVPLRRFEAVGTWLRTRTPPGEVVFHTHWDRFPELFFWNPGDVYVNGMDPIFEYAHDPSTYWKHHYISVDMARKHTAGVPVAAASDLEETWTVLVRDFDATWCVVEPRRTPGFAAYLDSDPRFRKAFEAGPAAVYRVLTP